MLIVIHESLEKNLDTEVTTVVVLRYNYCNSHIKGANSMKAKIFDSELQVMEILWKEGDRSAGQIAKILKEKIDWNRNTTYTVIKKCIKKGIIERHEPNFICKAVIKKEEVQQYETLQLIDKMFDGSSTKFFAAFLDHSNLSNEEIANLKKLVEKLK